MYCLLLLATTGQCALLVRLVLETRAGYSRVADLRVQVDANELGIPAQYDVTKSWPLVIKLPVANAFLTQPPPDGQAGSKGKAAMSVTG